MIHESSYWKEPLLTAASFLEQVRIGEEEPEDDLARAERELLIGFYSIRKLLDTFKISNATRGMQFDLSCFNASGENEVDYFNRSEIDELFDLTKPLQESRDLVFLCNQFVHSYILIFELEPSGRIKGVFVSSDRSRSRRLYFISGEQMTTTLRSVGNDYPASQQYSRNPKTGEWEAYDVET